MYAIKHISLHYSHSCVCIVASCVESVLFVVKLSQNMAHFLQFSDNALISFANLVNFSLTDVHKKVGSVQLGRKHYFLYFFPRIQWPDGLIYAGS
jgi:hypothetical protein